MAEVSVIVGRGQVWIAIRLAVGNTVESTTTNSPVILIHAAWPTDHERIQTLSTVSMDSPLGYMILNVASASGVADLLPISADLASYLFSPHFAQMEGDPAGRDMEVFNEMVRRGLDPNGDA